MKISDIITENNAFAHAMLRAQQKAFKSKTKDFKIPTVDIVIQLEPGEYKSDRLKDLKRLVKHKQKQDRKTDRWSKDRLTPKEPLSVHDQLPRTRITGQPSTDPARASRFPGKITKEPTAQSQSKLNTAVKDLFAQGMAPPEIEQYLVHELGLKPRIARKLIDQELYAPASRVKRANPFGSDIYKMKSYTKDRQRRLRKQDKDRDDDTETTNR